MGSTAGPGDPAGLIEDWITIWKSEAAALGVDRELQDGLARLAGAWARTALQAGVAADAKGRPGADAAAGSAAAADAPDAEPAAPFAPAAELALLRGELAGLRTRIERLEAGRRRTRRKPGAA